MQVNFDIGILAVIVLAAAGILYVGITVAWSIRPRKTVSLGVQTARGGTTHIIPGEGHVEAEDCMCHPRVDGLPGSLFVEHRQLRTAKPHGEL